MAFGTTPLLSLFEPPAEDPLSEEGKWAQTVAERPPMRKVVTFGLIGAATDSSHGDPNYSHWTRETFSSESGHVEAWACTEGGQLGAALETWRVALWTELGANLTGYLVYYGGGIGKGYAIRNYDGGVASFTGIAGGGGGFPQRLGIAINGDQIEAWGMYGGVWTLTATGTDTAHRGRFYAGIAIEDPTGGGLSMPCFGAGVPNRTQFFRWTRGYREEPLEVS